MSAQNNSSSAEYQHDQQVYISNSSSQQHKSIDSDSDSLDDPEKLVVGNWKIVDLPIITTAPGWDEQVEIFRIFTKMERFRDNEWKQRGEGYVKFIKNTKTNKIRLIGHALKTMRIFVNHFVIEKDIFCQLTSVKTNENTWAWGAMDFSDGVASPQKFSASFKNEEEYEAFQKEFEKACLHNSLIMEKEKV